MLMPSFFYAFMIVGRLCIFVVVYYFSLQIVNEQYFIRNPTASENKEAKTLSKTSATKPTLQPQPAVNRWIGNVKKSMLGY